MTQISIIINRFNHYQLHHNHPSHMDQSIQFVATIATF